MLNNQLLISFLADNLMYIPGGPVRFMGYGATKKSDPSVENVK